MAAIRQQGVYLTEFLVGFTALPAGLVMGGGVGYVVALVGLAVLLHACFGFYKIKKLEFNGGA
jgi:hypothetical protein